MNFLDQAMYDIGGLVFAGVIVYVVFWIWVKLYNHFH
jgi:hypothetical protein